MNSYISYNSGCGVTVRKCTLQHAVVTCSTYGQHGGVSVMDIPALYQGHLLNMYSMSA